MPTEIKLAKGKESDAKAFCDFRSEMAEDDPYSWASDNLSLTMAIMLIREYSQSNRCIFFLKDGEKIIGVLFLRFLPTVELLIDRLAILTKYRKRELASLLLATATITAEKRNFLKVGLYVKKDNDPALALYRKYGFETEATTNVSTLKYCRWLKPVVSRLLLVRNGTVYAMLRNGYGASRPGRRWIFPGGQADVGERSVDSVIRETQEEIGIAFTEADLSLVFEKYDPVYGKQMTFYVAKAPVKEPKLKEPEKFDKAEWVPFKNIKKLDGQDNAHIGVFMAEAVQALQKKNLLSRW